MTLCFLVILSHLVNSEGVCGDGWDQFHDKYYDICYKYFTEGLADYQTVVTACRSENDSSLPTINSKSEQDFINKLIVKYKMIDSVWLDATIKDRHIVWADSTYAEYDNWVYGRPVNNSICVEMITDNTNSLTTANMGKWQDVNCAKKNAYMCKRVVMWSDQRTERLIRDNRRMIDKWVARMTQNEAECHLPVGFIYVQLPNQVEPNVLCPKSTWSDVTTEYASNGDKNSHPSFHDQFLKFMVQAGEVRPRNQALSDNLIFITSIIAGTKYTLQNNILFPKHISAGTQPKLTSIAWE
ncbi:unnamed protein product [Medioppia subpectinata]|uniref:C-type lectin domain-containing protein n=1 Tax=Medioppia subpectinata TaxID=1979941 RepID=A0A7R9KBA9_9ACAR|nr:unnamed protein product [Medioppia subpectinata]CAG2100299.1 unnamed protein product [Medioppia subpectinata]